MAQYNLASLLAEIAVNLPTNNRNLISAMVCRATLDDMCSAFPIQAQPQWNGALGNGVQDDSAAFNTTLQNNKYVAAPPFTYLISNPVTIPAGATLELQPGAGFSYMGAGTIALTAGGSSFVSRSYGIQNDTWIWARSNNGARSAVGGITDPFNIAGRVFASNFIFAAPADNGQTVGLVTNLSSFQKFGGSLVTGARQAFAVYNYQNAATSSGNTFRDYVGGALISETDSGDGGTSFAFVGGNYGQGNYFGGNSQSRLNAGATFVSGATAHEFDCYNSTGSSMFYNWGINIVSFNAVRGTGNDAAIVLYSGGKTSSNGNNYGANGVNSGAGANGGAGFGFGLCFAEVDQSGLSPVAATATLIGAYVETIGTFGAAIGVDFTKVVFSGNAWQSNNCAIKQDGTLSIGGTVSKKVTVTSSVNFDGVFVNALNATVPVAFMLGNFGGVAAWSGLAASVGFIVGDAVGDWSFRLDSGGKMLWSVDSGTTAHMKLLTSGLVLSGSLSAKAPVTQSGTTYSQAANDNSIIINSSGAFTLTLLSAASNPGRLLYIKQIAAFTVVSASSNVVPLGSTTAGTAILSGATKYALLQSDGTSWITLIAN